VNDHRCRCRAVGFEVDDDPLLAGPSELENRRCLTEQLPATAVEAGQERELIKLASLTAALADALRRRGVTEPTASLAAEAGTTVFRVAFDRWINEPEEQDLPRLIRESLDALAKALWCRTTSSSSSG
jgi:hypothetical protein